MEDVISQGGEGPGRTLVRDEPRRRFSSHNRSVFLYYVEVPWLLLDWVSVLFRLCWDAGGYLCAGYRWLRQVSRYDENKWKRKVHRNSQASWT